MTDAELDRYTEDTLREHEDKDSVPYSQWGCGEYFTTAVEHRKYCSGRCRVAAWRARHEGD